MSFRPFSSQLSALLLGQLFRERSYDRLGKQER